MIINSETVQYTNSAVSDQLVEIFTMTKRSQPFYKTKRVGTNDFYYYTMLAALYQNRPIDIFISDILSLMPLLSKLDKETLNKIIMDAIEKYLVKEGQAGLFFTKKHGKWFSWRLV